MQKTIPLGRRAFLKHGTLFLSTASLGLTAASASFADDAAKQALRFGLITDLHHADKAPAGSRFYRETLGKLTENVSSN